MLVAGGCLLRGSLLLDDAALKLFSCRSQKLFRSGHLELHRSNSVSHTLIGHTFHVFQSRLEALGFAFGIFRCLLPFGRICFGYLCMRFGHAQFLRFVQQLDTVSNS